MATTKPKTEKEQKAKAVKKTAPVVADQKKRSTQAKPAVKQSTQKASEKQEIKKIVSEVKASARFIRVAPRKTRLVIEQLKGKPVDTALDQLRFMQKAAVRPITKLLQSAIANAENNFSLDRADLYIKSLVANDGPILKRYRPRAHGRSSAIRKRTSHIDIVLGVKEGAKTVAKKVDTKKNTDTVKVVSPDEVKKTGGKSGSGPKAPQEQGKDSKGFLKGVFQRKTG